LSVIIPVFNAESTVQRTLNSVFQSKDIIPVTVCVDDGSTDESGCKLDCWVAENENTVIIHSRNGGVSFARNLGLSVASTDYVTFVDSDDTISDMMYCDMLSYLKNNELDCVCCGNKKMYPNHSVSTKYVQVNTIISQRSNVIEFLQNAVLGSNVYVWGGVSLDVIDSACLKIFRRCLIEYCNIRFHVGRKKAEDWEFCIDYLYNCNQIGILSKCYYNYNRGISSTAINRFDDWLPFVLEDRKKFMRYFPNVDWEARMTGYMLLPISAVENVRVNFKGTDADYKIKDIFQVVIRYGVYQHDVPLNCTPYEQKLIRDLKLSVETNDYQKFKKIAYQASKKNVLINKLKQMLKKVIAR